MTQNSILLENINSDGLKEIVSDAVKNALASIKPKEDRYLSRQEARTKFGVSMPTLDKALRNGTLTGYRINGRILLKESQLNLSEIPIRKHR